MCPLPWLAVQYLQEFVKKMISSEEGQTFINKYKKKKGDRQLMEEAKAILPSYLVEYWSDSVNYHKYRISYHFSSWN